MSFYPDAPLNLKLGFFICEVEIKILYILSVILIIKADSAFKNLAYYSTPKSIRKISYHD